MIDIPISVTAAGGRTLEQFNRLIQQRVSLLKETPAKAITACAIQVLKSLRAITRLAKVSQPRMKDGTKPEIELCAGLYLSFKSMGRGRGAKKIPCLRLTGSHARFPLDNASLAIPEKGLKARLAQVYQWNRRNGKKVYIAASSSSVAQRYMKEIEKKRIAKYRGLAKSALGKLMRQVSLRGGSLFDKASALAQRVAERNAHVRKNLNGGLNEVGIRMEDTLDYASDALKGGESQIDSCLQSAMNKIAATINYRMKDLLDYKPITLNFDK